MAGGGVVEVGEVVIAGVSGERDESPKSTNPNPRRWRWFEHATRPLWARETQEFLVLKYQAKS